MADATQGDTDVQYLGLLVPALISLIAELLIHSFIIGVNVSNWWKGRSVTAVDHIVTSIGISRICVQWADILSFLMVKIFLLISLDSSYSWVIIEAFYSFFTSCNFWLTSLLSIVLCLKISNFHSRLFLYLRGVIIHRTGSLIVASALLSCFYCLKHLSSFVIEEDNVGTHNRNLNNTSMSCRLIHILHTYILVHFIPLLFSCISSVLLFSSLYHHTTKMKMSSNLSIGLETYYSAMRFVSVTFIYITFYIIGHFFSVLYYFFYCVTLYWLYIVLNFLPVLHSSYLIYRTAKLKSQMSKVLQYLTDFLFQKKDTEIRENIEVVDL